MCTLFINCCSVEKLKPEKELQRATSEILRRKLKIRDLFQRLDSLCAGGFPKSLFDSEGQIDSEDVGEHFLIYLMFRDEILIICAYLDMIFFFGG